MNGLLVVDKAAGMTSHDVVSAVRRLTGERSIGHLGTLDPMATGVLPLLLGRYTRLAQFFGDHSKRYSGTIRFGFATDTYDADGTPTSEPRALQHSLAELQSMAAEQRGAIDQLPPAFSAKKIGGVPAYKMARAGVTPPVRAVRITVYEFLLSDLRDDAAAFCMHISSGGYVRSVAHELGQRSGTGAHLASLRRTQAGPFTLEHSVTLDELSAASGDAAALDAMSRHSRSLLPEMPSVTVDERTLGQLRNGMQVNLPEFSDAALVKVFSGPRDLAAIVRRVAGTLMQPSVVLG